MSHQRAAIAFSALVTSSVPICFFRLVDAHRILVMECGRIVERGTHVELLAARGRDAEMWALQRSAEPLAADDE